MTTRHGLCTISKNFNKNSGKVCWKCEKAATATHTHRERERNWREKKMATATAKHENSFMSVIAHWIHDDDGDEK